MDVMDEAREALAEVFGDKSVSAGETRERLETLIEEIQGMLGALDDD